MGLVVIKADEVERWDSVVKSFQKYDVYYLNGYSKAFQQHGDGEPLLFYYEDNSTRAINVVMKRDIASDIHFKGKLERGKYFDFVTPYGYGGFIIEGDHKESLMQAYEVYCIDHGIICEFVRFHPIIENYKHSDELDYKVKQVGNTVTLDLCNEETIWKNITSKNRNMIRKAENNQIIVKNGLSKELLRTFATLYNGAMDRANASQYYYFGEAFYDSILNDIYENSKIFYAEYQGETIAASIMIFANGYLNYHLSGTATEYLSLAPTNLLLYKAACWGAQQKMKTMHLGGGRGGSTSDSLFSFKKSFNRKDTSEFYTGKKIFITQKYDMLVQVRKDETCFDITADFFPLYRV